MSEENVHPNAAHNVRSPVKKSSFKKTNSNTVPVPRSVNGVPIWTEDIPNSGVQWRDKSNGNDIDTNTQKMQEQSKSNAVQIDQGIKHQVTRTEIELAAVETQLLDDDQLYKKETEQMHCVRGKAVAEALQTKGVLKALQWKYTETLRITALPRKEVQALAKECGFSGGLKTIEIAKLVAAAALIPDLPDDPRSTNSDGENQDLSILLQELFTAQKKQACAEMARQNNKLKREGLLCRIKMANFQAEQRPNVGNPEHDDILKLWKLRARECRHDSETRWQLLQQARHQLTDALLENKGLEDLSNALKAHVDLLLREAKEARTELDDALKKNKELERSHYRYKELEKNIKHRSNEKSESNEAKSEHQKRIFDLEAKLAEANKQLAAQSAQVAQEASGASTAAVQEATAQHAAEAAVNVARMLARMAARVAVQAAFNAAQEAVEVQEAAGAAVRVMQQEAAKAALEASATAIRAAADAQQATLAAADAALAAKTADEAKAKEASEKAAKEAKEAKAIAEETAAKEEKVRLQAELEKEWEAEEEARRAERVSAQKAATEAEAKTMIDWVSRHSGDWYKVLGLEQSATSAEIKRAYRKVGRG
jgi:curved DNA-binding protein CbpA